MEYKNTKTGVTFSSPFVISGGDWVDVEFEEVEIPADKEEEKIPDDDSDSEEEQSAIDEAFDGITIAQIKQELDAFGVQYNKKATKKELYDLMMQQGA